MEDLSVLSLQLPVNLLLFQDKRFLNDGKRFISPKKIILNVWAFNKVTSKYIKKNLTEL